MMELDHVLGASQQPASPLRAAFLRWQCRVRQLAMRDNNGRPDDSITPTLRLPGETTPMGQIITVLNKSPLYSKTPELKHLVMRTNDPAQRRDKALQMMSETYYQKWNEFSDLLTATFPPRSRGASTIIEAGGCTLTFEAYNQRFDLNCRVRQLGQGEPLREATWWHNVLFNPNLSPDVVVLCFAPDWATSSADPQPAGS
jgi:hypothetical protein